MCTSLQLTKNEHVGYNHGAFLVHSPFVHALLCPVRFRAVGLRDRGRQTGRLDWVHLCFFTRFYWVLKRYEISVVLWEKWDQLLTGEDKPGHCESQITYGIGRQQTELPSSGGGSGGQREGLLGAPVLKDLGPRGIVVWVSCTAAIFQISLQWCFVIWVCSPCRQPCRTCDTAKCCWEQLHSNLSSIPYCVTWQVI